MKSELVKSAELKDAELIQKIISGEHHLYEKVIRRNNSFLYRAGRAYGYPHHDVEDLMQETYISAFRNLSKFRHESSLKTWLLRIMLNQCFQKRQKHSFTKELLMENKTESDRALAQGSNHTTSMVINRELGKIIEDALSGIPEDYRLVFTLRELNGLNTAETSELTNLSESNVKVRLNRAKSMLRKKIETMYSAEDIYEFHLVYCDKMVNKVFSSLNLY